MGCPCLAKDSARGRDGGSTAFGRRDNRNSFPATSKSIPLRMDPAEACPDSHPPYSPRRPPGGTPLPEGGGCLRTLHFPTAAPQSHQHHPRPPKRFALFRGHMGACQSLGRAGARPSPLRSPGGGTRFCASAAGRPSMLRHIGQRPHHLQTTINSMKNRIQGAFQPRPGTFPAGSGKPVNRIPAAKPVRT